MPVVLHNQRDLLRKRFCSRACLGRGTSTGRVWTEASKAKARETALRPDVHVSRVHCGSENPGWKGGDIVQSCAWCHCTFTAKRSRVVRDGMGKFCSCSCFYQWQASGVTRGERLKGICVICGSAYERKPSRMRRTCSAKCGCVLGRRVAKPRVKTVIECKLEAMLLALGVPFTPQYFIRFENGQCTIPDAFVSPRLALYVDGDYWHSRPEVVQRDRRIEAQLRDSGVLFHRILGSDINNNIAQVTSRLREVVNNACCK